MPALQTIKLGRLMLAIAITVLIADTAPHPSLSAGLLESSWHRLEGNVIDHSGFQTALSDMAQ